MVGRGRRSLSDYLHASCQKWGTCGHERHWVKRRWWAGRRIARSEYFSFLACHILYFLVGLFFSMYHALSPSNAVATLPRQGYYWRRSLWRWVPLTLCFYCLITPVTYMSIYKAQSTLPAVTPRKMSFTTLQFDLWGDAYSLIAALLFHHQREIFIWGFRAWWHYRFQCAASSILKEHYPHTLFQSFPTYLMPSSPAWGRQKRTTHSRALISPAILQSRYLLLYLHTSPPEVTWCGVLHDALH